MAIQHILSINIASIKSGKDKGYSRENEEEKILQEIDQMKGLYAGSSKTMTV